MARRALVLLFHDCELLDVAGPVQVLHEAGARSGDGFEFIYCGEARRVRTAQGLMVDAEPLRAPRAGDWVIIPGLTVHDDYKTPPATLQWIREAWTAGARICSVCTGAFLLGEAGLLDGRRCTTHWRRVQQLQRMFPNATVLGDRLYVEDGSIVTSAGISAGIDMTLWLLERDYGPVLTAEVAREMVVYLRRDGNHQQESVYLDYQTHLNPGVHGVQDYLTKNPACADSVAELARRFGMSERNLSRAFKDATGISVHQYRTRLRVEHARMLLRNPRLTLRSIADQCGFADVRQLRRVVTRHLGASPEVVRRTTSRVD